MFNLLVVDDFEIDRKNIIETITSMGEIDIQVVGECENGKEALEFVSENKVDIILTDIDMPYLNGLELAKNINATFPSIKIVFCSLYDEFEYARKALYLNTYGYILKPIDKLELLGCLKSIMGDITSEVGFRKEYEELKQVLEDSKPQLLDHFIKDIIYGGIKDEKEIWHKAEYLGVKIKKAFFGLVYMNIDDYQRMTQHKTIEQKQIFTIKVYEKFKQLVMEFENVLITKLNDSHFVCMVSDTLYEELYKKCMLIAQEVINAFKQSDTSITLSISDKCEDIREIKNLLEQCEYIMRYKFTLGSGKVLTSEDIPAETYSRNIDMNTMQKDIRFLLNSGNETEIQDYVQSLLKHETDNIGQECIRQIGFSVMVCIILVLNENNEKVNPAFYSSNSEWERLLGFETITDIGNWMKEVLVSSNKQLSCKANRKYDCIVDKAKEFINENYMHNIGIELIAEKVNYSPNYLSCVFKKVSGETIADYMTRLKIERAKEMLLDIRCKIYSIAEALGFSNTAYFCSVFKKMTSMTPNEYRERAITSNER